MLHLAGKPLVQWTIECALQSSIDQICVTSDDERILDLAATLGVAYLIERPASLADSAATTTDVVAHALEYCYGAGFHPVTLCLLQPTSPLRSTADIDNALELHGRSNASVVSVCELEHPLEWCVTVNQTGIMQGIFGEFPAPLPAGREKHYRLNGAVYVSDAGSFARTHSLFGEHPVAYVMDRERSVDIDTMFDFLHAQTLLSRASGCRAHAENDQ